MMRNHKPISIADQVFEQLEHDILIRRNTPQGEILTELKLSAELGVSRTPIREAHPPPGAGAHSGGDRAKGLTVVGISEEDMQDIYEIRQRLEDAAAARAALHITPEAPGRDEGDSGSPALLYRGGEAGRRHLQSDQESGLPGSMRDFYNSSGSTAPFTKRCSSLHKKIHEIPQGLRPQAPAAPLWRWRSTRPIYLALEAARRPAGGARRRMRHVANARANIEDITHRRRDAEMGYTLH